MGISGKLGVPPSSRQSLENNIASPAGGPAFPGGPLGYSPAKLGLLAVEPLQGGARMFLCFGCFGNFGAENSQEFSIHAWCEPQTEIFRLLGGNGK